MQDVELFKVLTAWSISHSILNQRSFSSDWASFLAQRGGLPGQAWGRGIILWYFD